MKFTNEQMFRCIVAMHDLHETGKLGYAIARNMRKMMDAAKEYLDIREEVLKKYGTDKGDGRYLIPQENTEAFWNEISQYATIEHDVDVFHVSADEFMSGGMDSEQMFILDWMVEEGS